MIALLIKDGVVDWPVAINEDQLQVLRDTYPEHVIVEQTGDETSGWLYDGVKFSPPPG